VLWGSVRKTFERKKGHDTDGMSNLTKLEENCSGFTLVSL